MTVLFVLTVLFFWILSGAFAYWLAYREREIDDPEDDFFFMAVGGLAALIITLLCLALKKIRDFVESM